MSDIKIDGKSIFAPDFDPAGKVFCTEHPDTRLVREGHNCNTVHPDQDIACSVTLRCPECGVRATRFGGDA